MAFILLKMITTIIQSCIAASSLVLSFDD